MGVYQFVLATIGIVLGIPGFLYLMAMSMSWVGGDGLIWPFD